MRSLNVGFLFFVFLFSSSLLAGCGTQCENQSGEPCESGYGCFESGSANLCTSENVAPPAGYPALGPGTGSSASFSGPGGLYYMTSISAAGGSDLSIHIIDGSDSIKISFPSTDLGTYRGDNFDSTATIALRVDGELYTSEVYPGSSARVSVEGSDEYIFWGSFSGTVFAGSDTEGSVTGTFASIFPDTSARLIPW